MRSKVKTYEVVVKGSCFGLKVCFENGVVYYCGYKEDLKGIAQEYFKETKDSKEKTRMGCEKGSKEFKIDGKELVALRLRIQRKLRGDKVETLEEVKKRLEDAKKEVIELEKRIKEWKETKDFDADALREKAKVAQKAALLKALKALE